MGRIIVSGSFDDLRSVDVRFLEEAARLGDVHVQLWSDRAATTAAGKAPKFPEAERLYFLDAIRYVRDVMIVDDALPRTKGGIWAVRQGDDMPTVRKQAQLSSLEVRVIPDGQLRGFPLVDAAAVPTPGRKKVLVTGCYDWLHTGHVRFFEEVSQYGDVYAIVGHDANIELLKGAGHPQFGEEERRYMVQALRQVKQCLVSTGHGWLDAEPEIARIKPDIYAVNEDGDKVEKKNFCEANGIEYLVLKRNAQIGFIQAIEHGPSRILRI